MSTLPVDLDHPDQRSLTRQQRRERTADALTAAAATSDAERRHELLDFVVRINMEVARSVANRFLNRGVEEDDLLQVAYVALTRAARGFDPGRHDEFLSYAVPCIRGELKKHFRDRGWTVRPPRRIQETQARVAAADAELCQRLGRSPRPSEYAEHLDVAVDDVIEALSADGCFTPTSLDRPMTDADGSGYTTIGDLLGQEDADRMAAEARTTLAPVVRRLKERDRRILYLRFFEDRTQQEIADEIGVTQMQVSRLLSRILRDLRSELAADDSTTAVSAHAR